MCISSGVLSKHTRYFTAPRHLYWVGGGGEGTVSNFCYLVSIINSQSEFTPYKVCLD